MLIASSLRRMCTHAMRLSYKTTKGSLTATVKRALATTSQPLPTRLAKTFTYHTKTVKGLAVLPDGKVASVSHDSTIAVKDIETDSPPKVMKEGDSLLALSVIQPKSPNWLLAVGGTEKKVSVWDIAHSKGRLLSLSPHTHFISALTGLPNGNFASGSWDKKVNLWDLSQPDPLVRIYDLHTGIITSLALLSRGTYLASGSEDGSVKVWEAKPLFGDLVQDIPSKSAVKSMAALPDGNTLLVGSADGTIRHWNPAIGQPSAKLLYTFQALSAVTALTIFPDGQTVATGHETGDVMLWDLVNRKWLYSLPKSHVEPVNSLVTLKGSLLSAAENIKWWTA